MGKKQLKNMTLPEMQEWFSGLGEKKFRALQVFRRIYSGASSFDEMTELSKKLRETLAENAEIDAVQMVRRQISAKDGTRKYLFRVAGGSAVESVFMRYKYGNTACISSQAGCRMGCAFCASGIDGLERNLSAGEIVDQVAAMSRDTGERIGHVVVMGTGEPFDNYEELIRAIEILHDENGLGLGLRNITVSTCGLLPKILRFAEDMPQVNIAVSLHAPDDGKRRKLMPVASAYGMSELMDVCRRYTERTHRRITFEYALIDGVNDGDEDARRLAQLLKGMLCHVNLIPLNRVEETSFTGSARRHAEHFASILSGRGIETTVRRELGSDISAACGQLRLSERSPAAAADAKADTAAAEGQATEG